MKNLIIISGFILFGCNKISNRDIIATAKYIQSPPVIDGQVDETWSVAQWNPIDSISTTYSKKFIAGATDFSALFKVSWDNTNFYFLFRINDDIKFDLNDIKSASDRAMLDNVSGMLDLVSLYFDMNANDRNILFCSGDNYDFSVTYKDVLSKKDFQVKYASFDDSTGYNVEIKIPWKSLNFKPSDGKIIGFNSRVSDCDNDSKEDILYMRPCVFSWNGKLILKTPNR